MKFFITLIFIITSTILLGQENESFCGYIKYEIKYIKGKRDITSKTESIKSETRFFCKNNFKILQDGLVSDIYDGDGNKYYTFSSDARDSTITMIDADQFYGEKPPKYLPIQKIIYDGEEYSSLIDKEFLSKTIYLFNDSIKIDPQKFNGCKVFHWSTFYKHTNGFIPVKIISKSGRSRTIYEAIEFKEVDLSPSFFSLPDGYEVIDNTEDFKILNW